MISHRYVCVPNKTFNNTYIRRRSLQTAAGGMTLHAYPSARCIISFFHRQTAALKCTYL